MWPLYLQQQFGCLFFDRLPVPHPDEVAQAPAVRYSLSWSSGWLCHSGDICRFSVDPSPGTDRKTRLDGTRSEEWQTGQKTPLMPLQQNPSATHSTLTFCAPSIRQDIVNSGFSVCSQDRRLDFLRAWHSELAHPCDSPHSCALEELPWKNTRSPHNCTFCASSGESRAWRGSYLYSHSRRTV